MEDPHAVSGYLVTLVAMGVAGQWLASRTRLPSVLWMLMMALFIGPITNWFHPDQVLGPMLFPLVSLSVAIILFEGSLELRLPDLRHIGWPLLRLLTVGASLTAVMAAIGAYFLFGMRPAAAALLGTLLVVTGPTVIGPILVSVRPNARISQLLRWEGIVIDPLGAVLALIVFESVEPLATHGIIAAIETGSWQVAMTLLSGTALGILGGLLLTSGIKYFWIPDYLYGVSSLGILLVCFEVANRIQSESGLLAATIMGVLTANSRRVSRERVHHFHQNLSALLIPTLFLLLGTRLELADLNRIWLPLLLFAAFLIAVVRPISVLASLAGTSLGRRERVFVAGLAPRGIVAAAVSSLFALRLGESFGLLVPVTFGVIVITVVYYSLTAGPLARALELSSPNPQGCLILGAHRFGREVARALSQCKIPVQLIDANRANAETARMAGLPVKNLNVLSEPEGIDSEIDFSNIGYFLAMTSNSEVNILACRHFSETLGRKHVYQLPPAGLMTGRARVSDNFLAGRVLFSVDASFEFLDDCLDNGYEISATQLTSVFTVDDYFRENADSLVLFRVSRSGQLHVASHGSDRRGMTDSTIIALRRSVDS